jgi:hypothetical protein
VTYCWILGTVLPFAFPLPSLKAGRTGHLGDALSESGTILPFALPLPS